jgi:hypothetical protein
MFDSEAVLLQPADAGDDRRMEAARRWIKHQPRSFARSVSESAAARLHVMQRLDDRFDMAILGFVQSKRWQFALPVHARRLNRHGLPI